MQSNDTQSDSPTTDRNNAEDAFHPLHPNIRTLWTIGSLIFAVIVTGGVLLLDVFEALEFAPRGLSTAIIGTLMMVRAFAWPRMRYKRWSFAIREHDVVVANGVLYRRRICVPRLRVQHVDIESGPLERHFGLCHVSLHTAGSSAAAAMIVGIEPRVAERIRSMLVGDAVEQADRREESTMAASTEPTESSTVEGEPHSLASATPEAHP